MAKSTRSEPRGKDDISALVGEEQESPFDPEIEEYAVRAAESGLDVNSALYLIGKLNAHVPAASKESLEKIRLMDKLLNSGRYMIETKLKNDELQRLRRRIDSLETALQEALNRQTPKQGAFEDPTEADEE